MEDRLKRVNQLQVPTWNALKINETAVMTDFAGMPVYAKQPLKKEYADIQTSQEKVRQIQPGKAPVVIRAIKDYVKSFGNYRLHIVIPEGVVVDEPIILNFGLDGNDALLIDDILISAGAGSRATIVMSYSSDNRAACFRCGFTALELNENANILLIKAQMLSEKHDNADATEVILAEGAYAHVILVELGAKKSVSGCSVQLKGNGSSANLDGVYIVNHERELDLNYRIEYRGKKSEGNITIRGALLDQARKVAKSTLDFLSGAVDSKGREEESVLALSPTAVNISAPLLLCGEDKVDGQHATTTGRVDQGQLFYLMSRGIAEGEARKLIALASFGPILDKIEPEFLREEIMASVREVLDHAN